MLDADYGVPLGPPVVKAGVWSRRWSRADIALDCAAWEAKLIAR